MSEARAMKWREYGTDVISHELSYANNSEIHPQVNVRAHNTHLSRVLETEGGEPDINYRIGLKYAQNVHARSRERLLKERPLTTKIMRTSY